MEPRDDATQTLPPLWKWQALFTPPAAPLDRQWRTWLAQAQQAEEHATLAYWARRRGSSN